MIMVGDPRQFSAVGRGGMFSHLTTPTAPSNSTRSTASPTRWERGRHPLRLRRGDPASSPNTNGTDASTTAPPRDGDELVGGVAEARRRGESVAMMANTNAHRPVGSTTSPNTTASNRGTRPHGPSLGVGDQRLLVGDEVVTRRNQRTLRTDRGDGQEPGPLDHHCIHPDSAVTVTGRSGHGASPRRLRRRGPRARIRPDQPRHPRPHRRHRLLLLDGPTDGRGLYTSMTRGRLPTTPTSSPVTPTPPPTSSPKPHPGLDRPTPPSPYEPHPRLESPSRFRLARTIAFSQSRTLSPQCRQPCHQSLNDNVTR
jgi:hypothetical protein